MENKYYIYAHINPLKNEIFYIGKGCDYRAYIKSNRSKWWKKIVNKYGLIVDILEEGLTNDEAMEREKFYIQKIGRRDLGKGPLVNLTDGGEGATGVLGKDHKGEKNPRFGQPVSEETRNKQSLKMKGRKQSKETIDKRVSKIKGLKRSAETCVKIGLIHKGKVVSDSTIAKQKETVIKKGGNKMGRNSRAIPIEYEGVLYSCIKELYISKFNTITSYRNFTRQIRIGLIKVIFIKKK